MLLPLWELINKDGDEVFAAGFPFDAYWSGPGLPSQPAIALLLKQVLIRGLDWLHQ